MKALSKVRINKRIYTAGVLALSVTLGFGLPLADSAQANYTANPSLVVAAPMTHATESKMTDPVVHSTVNGSYSMQAFNASGSATPANGSASGGEIVEVSVDQAPAFTHVAETEFAVVALTNTGSVVAWRKDASSFSPKVIDQAFFDSATITKIVASDNEIYFTTADGSVFVSDTAVDLNSANSNPQDASNPDILQILVADNVLPFTGNTELEQVSDHKVLESGSLLAKNLGDDSTAAELDFWPTAILFGDAVASQFETLSANTVQTVTPAHEPGSTDVSVIYSLRVDQQNVTHIEAVQPDADIIAASNTLTVVLNVAYTFDEVPEAVSPTQTDHPADAETDSNTDSEQPAETQPPIDPAQQSEVGEDSEVADSAESSDDAIGKSFNRPNVDPIGPLLQQPQAPQNSPMPLPLVQ